MKQAGRWLLLSAWLLVAGGCQVSLPMGDSALTLHPQTGDVQTVHFDTAYFSYDPGRDLTIVLLDGPADAPHRAATVRLFWRPRTGRTPLEKTATNAVIRYIVFPPSDPPVAAVYAGAGFLNPRSDEGADHFVGDLWQTNLRLSDASAGYEDVLGAAGLTGPIRAQRDDAQTKRLLRQLQQRITRCVGYPVLVGR